MYFASIGTGPAFQNPINCQETNKKHNRSSGIYQIFNEDDISGELKIKCTDPHESTVFHKTRQRFLALRHIVPFNRQRLYDMQLGKQ